VAKKEKFVVNRNSYKISKVYFFSLKTHVLFEVIKLLIGVLFLKNIKNNKYSKTLF
jgi:hypothetical protein